LKKEENTVVIFGFLLLFDAIITSFEFTGLHIDTPGYNKRVLQILSHQLIHDPEKQLKYIFYKTF
jgi:hypothetical protein